MLPLGHARPPNERRRGQNSAGERRAKLLHLYDPLNAFGICPAPLIAAAGQRSPQLRRLARNGTLAHPELAHARLTPTSSTAPASSPSGIPPAPRKDRATTTPTTERHPAARSASRQARSVAPVVATSSTNAIARPATGADASTRKAAVRLV